jgi:hypothetical protein
MKHTALVLLAGLAVGALIGPLWASATPQRSSRESNAALSTRVTSLANRVRALERKMTVQAHLDVSFNSRIYSAETRIPRISISPGTVTTAQPRDWAYVSASPCISGVLIGGRFDTNYSMYIADEGLTSTGWKASLFNPSFTTPVVVSGSGVCLS